MLISIVPKKSKILVFFIFIYPTFQFNIDINPSSFYPSTKNNVNQLFGYSLSTTKKDHNSFLVGAPKSVGKDAKTRGQVYKCLLNSHKCDSIKFSFEVERNVSNLRNERFGSSLVQLDNGHLVACSLTWLCRSKYPKLLCMPGKCYSGPLSQKNLSPYAPFNLTLQNSLIKVNGQFVYYLRSAQYGFSVSKSWQPQTLTNNQICAPSYKVNYKTTEGKYAAGECYIGHHEKLEAIDLVQKFQLMKNKHFYHSNAQFGTSLHKSTNNDVVFGAPGFHNWMGTVFFMQHLTNKKCEYPDQTSPYFSYIGYSVTSLKVETKTCFASGGPNTDYIGETRIWCIGWCSVESRQHLTNNEFGSYFGHGVARLDLEGDGVDELVVSAPLSNQSLGDEGRVYVYKHDGSKWRLLNELKGGSVAWARYGWLVQGLGDVDQDGFEDLLVGTHLEDSGMAYVHYGSKSGFDDVNVQKLTVGRMSSFSVLESANGYPNILVGISSEDQVYLFKSRPVHALNVTLSSAEKFLWWRPHSCNQSAQSASMLLNVTFEYLVPEQETATGDRIEKIKGLRYKLVTNQRGLVDSESFGREVTRKGSKHELEEPLDFTSSDHMSILLPLLFPYNKIPQDVNRKVLISLHVLESDTTSGPMFHRSQKKKFYFEIYFKRMFITLSGKAEVNFWTVGRKTLPFTLGYQHESVVEGVLTNTGEPIFNANFTIEYPSWMLLRNVTAEPACFSITCEGSRRSAKADYVTEVCTSSEALTNLETRVFFRLEHSTTVWDKSLGNKVYLQKSFYFLEPHYNSNISAISTLLDSSLLHKTPHNSSFVALHFYDIRSNNTHPAFKLLLQEPFRAFEPDVCCFETQISVVFKNGKDKTDLYPVHEKDYEKPSLGEYLEESLKNSSSIDMSCFSCPPWTVYVHSLNNNQSVDLLVTTTVTGKLLSTLQRFSSFSYHTKLTLTPATVTASFKDSQQGSFKHTTETYEVISHSSTTVAVPPTPFRLLLVCIVAGLVGLVFLMFLLKLCGFFKREKRELLRESKRKSKIVAETEGVGTTGEQAGIEQ